MKVSITILQKIRLGLVLACIFSLANSNQSTAQVKTAKNLKRIQTIRFEPETSNKHMIYLSMGFNDADAKNRMKNIDASEIESITLVYTLYRASARFNQMKLNQDRTAKLHALMPQISSNPEIKWYWVAQTGCDNPGACRDFFHGFEIRLKSEEEKLSEEIGTSMLDFYVKKYSGGATDSKKLDSLSALEGSSIIKICDTSYRENIVSKSRLGSLKKLHEKADKKFARKAVRRGLLKPGQEFELYVNSRSRITAVEGVEDFKQKQLIDLFKRYYRVRSSKYHGGRVGNIYTIGIDYKGKGLGEFVMPVDEDYNRIDSFYDRVEYVEVVSCGYYDTSLYPSGMTPSMDLTKLYTAEDVVTKVFDRNKHWKNNVVITDVTGSMAPYLGQFLVWHQLNLKHAKNKEFVFFNDGDNMRDHRKRTGHVGGLYHIQTPTYSGLEAKLYKAQRRGGGGDAPENNIEAALFALDKNPRASGIIMIADNWATPRDLKLLDKVNKPIHVVLCGTSWNGVNTKYLDLVRKNGGTLHTIEDDLTELAKLNEGESVTVGEQTFTIRGGKFVSEGGKRDRMARWFD